MAVQGPCRNWLRLQPSPKRRALGPGNLAWLQSICEDLNRETRRLPRHLIPTRLIDVRATATSDCRLVVTDPEAPPTDTRYIALSYCWGNQEESKAQLTTRRGSLKERLRGFTLAEASPVLRDAVEVARALGIPHLWVDSVCIVQDDRLDWEKEAANMSLVYRHAWLTVCAMNTGSCLEHFLERPPPQYSTPVPFKSRLHPGVDGSYWVRWHTSIARNLGGRTHLGADMTSRWMTRGWTFQELHLPSNVLMFGKHKMHYRGSRWEFPEGSDGFSTGASKGSTFDLEMLREDDKALISGWTALMAKASERNLTKPTDKLPSVSGMARIATQNCPQQYLAGIRKDCAHRDLMWSQQLWVLDNHGTTLTAVIDSLEKQAPYIAPSWSWASRAAAIDGWTQGPLLKTIYVQDVEKEYKNMEAYTVVVGANPFGEVTGGVMTVTAAVLPIDSQQLRFLDMPVTRSPYQRWVVRIGSRNMAIIVLDGHFGAGEESSQGLSLVLLGSCLPRRIPIQKADFDEILAQYWGQDETIDGLEVVSESSSYYGDNRDPQDSDVASYTGVEEGGVCIPGSPQDYSQTEGGKDDAENRDGEAGAVDEDSEAGTYSEDGEHGTGSEDWGTDTDSEGFIVGPRAAYGIVVCPAKRQQGKYLRVGVWSSPDGLDYLRAQEPKTVEIV